MSSESHSFFNVCPWLSVVERGLVPSYHVHQIKLRCLQRCMFIIVIFIPAVLWGYRGGSPTTILLDTDCCLLPVNHTCRLLSKHGVFLCSAILREC